MRLVDADKLIDTLGLWGCYKHENPKAYDTLMLYEILEAIEDQPTAYDVDKVVEELTVNAIEENGIDYEMDISLDDAIDIVKRGGIE